jgi:hypothetical protein
MLKRLFKKNCQIKRKSLLLNWESLKKEDATLLNFLDSEKFVPGGYQEN